jgi:hypothetical protein
LRLRFDARELTLLRGAEQVQGVALAHTVRPDQLRTALSLAKAGHKLSRADAGTSVSLDESELSLLLAALQYSSGEVQHAGRSDDGANGQDVSRRDVVFVAFPELVERGAWRSFGLARELEALAARLQTALRSG